jgi:hypothetical protein
LLEINQFALGYMDSIGKPFSLPCNRRGLGIKLDDEFLIYLKGKIGKRLIVSFENIDLLLWGNRYSGNVRLLGLTLAIGINDLEAVTENKLDQLADKANIIMRKALSLSQRSKIPFFVILYSLSGGSLFRVTDPRNPLNLSQSFEVEENKMPATIEGFFNTNLVSTGTAKPVNKSTSDWFHDWTRVNLPTEYVKANIDGLVLTQEGKPAILMETKRSFAKPTNWQPYQADSRNYYLQDQLAKKTGLRFWTIYHEKGIPVKDNSDVVLFIVIDVALGKENWISCHRFDTNALKVAEMLEEACEEKANEPYSR